MNIGLAILLIALAIAVFTDLQRHKVPNWLVASGLLAGLTFQGISPESLGVLHDGGATGLISSLGGIAVGFVALLPIYALRAMGAGDVKLMMVVGAFLGPLHTLGAVVLTFAAGGVLAIVAALAQRALGQTLTNLRFMLTQVTARGATGGGMRFEPLQHTAARMPYALAIAAGTLLQLYLVRTGGWLLG